LVNCSWMHYILCLASNINWKEKAYISNLPANFGVLNA